MRWKSPKLRSIANEILKLKNSYLITIMVLSAIFIPSIYFFHYLIDSNRLLPEISGNPWGKFFSGQLTMTPTLITFFVVLVATFVVQIEHRSEGLKQLFTLPVKKSNIYFGKLIIASLVVLTTYLLFLIFSILCGYMIGFIIPDYGFTNYKPDLIFMAKVLFSSYTTTLGILAIQYWVSFKTKNFILPVGIGIVCIILGLILFRSPRFSPFMPYAYNISNFMNLNFKNPNSLVWLTNYSTYSVIVFLIFSIFGYVNVSRSNII